jgi:hypothetical protein
VSFVKAKRGDLLPLASGGPAGSLVATRKVQKGFPFLLVPCLGASTRLPASVKRAKLGRVRVVEKA